MNPVQHHHPVQPPTEYARYALAFALLFALAALAGLVTSSPLVWLVAGGSALAGAGYRFADGIIRAQRADAALLAPRRQARPAVRPRPRGSSRR